MEAWWEHNKNACLVFAAGFGSYSSSPACSLSSGSILSRTWEYWTLALTQAARGAAAALARFAFWKQDRHKSKTINWYHQPTVHPISIALSRQGHLWIEWGHVPVEQLFHALADLWCDVPGLKRSDVLPHTTLSQKAEDKKLGKGGQIRQQKGKTRKNIIKFKKKWNPK